MSDNRFLGNRLAPQCADWDFRVSGDRRPLREVFGNNLPGCTKEQSEKLRRETSWCVYVCKVGYMILVDVESEGETYYVFSNGNPACKRTDLPENSND